MFSSSINVRYWDVLSNKEILNTFNFILYCVLGKVNLEFNRIFVSYFKSYLLRVELCTYEYHKIEISAACRRFFLGFRIFSFSLLMFYLLFFFVSEASPDFNQKKLPYLPNLPPSVQVNYFHITPFNSMILSFVSMAQNEARLCNKVGYSRCAPCTEDIVF